MELFLGLHERCKPVFGGAEGVDGKDGMARSSRRGGEGKGAGWGGLVLEAGYRDGVSARVAGVGMLDQGVKKLELKLH